MSVPVKTIFIELRASADRLKSDMADAGTALDRIGTGGAEAGRKVSAGVAVASESLGKLVRASVEAGVAVEGIIIAAAKYSGVAAASAGNTEGLVNTYRGLRIALDPSVFTVATVAIGILAEQTVRLTLARAKLIEQQSLIAAKGGLSLGAVERADTVASIAGGGANANTIRSLQEALQSRSASNPLAVDSGLGMLGISGSGTDPEILAKIAQGFASIEDPAKRAQAAVRLFGENNAGAALEQLTGRFAAASDAATRFGLGLNATARTQIYQFRKDIQSLADPFVFLEENIKAGGKSIGETLAQMAGAADDLAHRLNRALGSGGNTLLQNLTGARPQGPSALTPEELAAPNQRLTPGGQIQQGLQADDLFAQQQVAAINKQNTTAAGQRKLQESAQKRADEAYAQLESDQAARQKNPHSPNLLSGAQRFALAQDVQSAQGQANAHKARADALEQDEAEAKAAADAAGSIAEAGVNNQIAANRRLAESKRQDLDNSLAIERETAAAKIDGIDNVQDRARASAAVELGLAQEKAARQKVIDQSELANYITLVNKRAAIASEGLTTKDYTAETTARGDIAGARDQAAQRAKALDQSVNVAALKLGATQVTAEREWSEEVTKAWEETWEKARKARQLAELQPNPKTGLNALGDVPGSQYDYLAAQKAGEITSKGGGETAALQIEGQKYALESKYGEQVGHSLAQEIEYRRRLADLDAQANELKIHGLDAELEAATVEAEAVAGTEKEIEALSKVAQIQQEINQLKQQGANAQAKASGQTQTMQTQQSLPFQIGQARRAESDRFRARWPTAS